MRASGVPRCELFLTTKLWMDEARPERVAAALDDSLAQLQTSYVDLLLIHWPLKFRPGTVLARDGAVGDFSATWAAMEALVASGKARSLGVSNFDEAQLSRLLDDAKKIPPAVNQVEAHPKFPNQALVDFCLSRDVAVVAWGPLGGDPRRLGEDSMLWATAKMHAVSLCRCALRWNLERGVAVIPKSTRPAHVADALAATAGGEGPPSPARVGKLRWHMRRTLAMAHWRGLGEMVAERMSIMTQGGRGHRGDTESAGAGAGTASDAYARQQAAR